MLFNFNKGQWFALLLIVALITMRSYITIPNFSPMLGASVVAGIVLSGPMALVVPIVSMVASDLVLFFKQASGVNGMGFFDWMSFQPVIYLLMGLSVWLGTVAKRFRNSPNLITGTMAGLSSSVSFFILSNFVTWLDPWGWKMYTMDWNGLIQCFVMALPFFTPTLVSTVIFVPLFLGLFSVISSKLNLPKQYKLRF